MASGPSPNGVDPRTVITHKGLHNAAEWFRLASEEVFTDNKRWGEIIYMMQQLGALELTISAHLRRMAENGIRRGVDGQVVDETAAAVSGNNNAGHAMHRLATSFYDKYRPWIDAANSGVPLPHLGGVMPQPGAKPRAGSAA